MQRKEYRLEFFGANEIEYERKSPWYIYLLKSFLDPFVLILAVIVFVSYFTDILFAAPGEESFMTILIILTMIVISVLLKFFQEYKSRMEADKLKDLVPTTATVLRKDIGRKEVIMSDIVPGDIVHLAAGDLIPADLRIISCKDLFISQSSLTGESEPVEKFPDNRGHIYEKGIADLDNILLMGTIVVSGSATAIVLETGNETYFGTIAESIWEDRGETSFEKGVKSVSYLLIRFMLIMVPIVFLINGISKGDWLEAFLFAISIAVGLTPEMLPTIVSTNLAKGAISLSKRKTVVKRLNSIQNFGAMDVLCTDKTGTLTLDKIVLEKHLDVLGRENDRVLRHAYLNSYYQTGLKNLLDLAVIEFGEEKGVASAFIPFLPMLPIQLLVQNLLYSISQIAIPWDTMDEEYLRKPQQWNADDIGKFMIYIGPISSIFDIVTFWVMWNVFNANTVEMAPLFQSGWFIVGVVSQTLIVHMIRTRKIPFIESRASTPLMIMTFVIIAIGIIIPFTSFGTYIGLVPLPANYFIWFIGIILAYSILTQIAKNLYIKKFDSWI